MVVGPQRRIFLGALFVGILSLLALDLHFGPNAFDEDPTHPLDAGTVPTSEPDPVARPTATGSSQMGAPSSTVRVTVDPTTRVPTIVARFESEAAEPTDESAIRALATAMIEAHDSTVVLEGHSDLRGGDDYNHEISLRRAEYVKARLVDLGVSADRIETSGLGATHPLHSDIPDAQSVNRRVEVRWIIK